MKTSLNHVFRTIWSEALNTWIAVSELTPGKGKSRSCNLSAAPFANGATQDSNIAKSKRRLRFKPLIVALACCYSIGAQATPIGAQIINGSANINRAGNTLTVSNSANAIINWQSFSIGKGESTNFIQPTASSAVLNRVIGADPSILLGSLTSNGKVFLINPAGIMVGQGARIDVGSFVASTLNLSNTDFLAGKLNFSPTLNAGAIRNDGGITTSEGGSVYLVAPQVENNGIINTPKGETILAAGNTVQLIDTGTPGVTVQLTGSDNNATNLGQILADSGRIGMVGAVVKNSGTLNADSVISQGGRVFLKASNRVEAGGMIGAKGASGGDISVLANMQNGTVDVIGTLDASSSGSGNGGFIETSAAHLQVADFAHITTAAPNGRNGTWLIDPLDFTIAPSGGDITGGLLSTMLGANSVVVSTAAGTNSATNLFATVVGNGDIFVNDAVTWATANTLTLSASRNIAITAAVTGTSGSLSLSSPAGTISSGAGLLQLNTLEVASSGNVSIIGMNNINTVAANVTAGTFLLENATNNLTVGTAGATTGVTASGVATLWQYNAGNVNVSQNFTSNTGMAKIGVASGSGTLSVAAGATVTGNGVNVYTSGGAISLNGNLTDNAAGGITVGGAGTGAISGTGVISTTGLLTTNSAGGTVLNGANTVGSFNATNITSGNVELTNTAAAFGVTGISQAGGGNVTVNNTGALTTNGANVSATNGNVSIKASGLSLQGMSSLSATNITLTADLIDINVAANAATISGTGSVTLEPATSGRPIELGAKPGTANSLVLSTNELNTITVGILQGQSTVGGTLHIGSSSAGKINVTAAISVSGSNTLTLESGSEVTQAGAGTITASKLAIKSGGNVALDTATNVVSSLAGAINGAGGTQYFHFNNSGTLTIDTVDNIQGISIANIPTSGYTAGSPNGVIALQSDARISQTANGPLAGAAVWANSTGFSSDYIYLSGASNPTGIVAGSSPSSFSYWSSNTIALMNVDGHSGISASGDITLDAPGFSNSLSSPLSTSTRWIIYAASPANVSKGGLTSNFRAYGLTGMPEMGFPQGNGFIYASTLPRAITVDTTLASGTASHIYGATPTAVFGYNAGTAIDKEDITGAPVFNPVISSTTNAGSYNVAYASGLSLNGTGAYTLTGIQLSQIIPADYAFTPGTGVAYTVDPAPVTVTTLPVVASLTGTVSKVYDGTDVAKLAPDNFKLSGFANGESASVIQSTGTYASKDVGSGILVSATLAPSNFNAVGNTKLSNYILPTSASGTIGTITPLAVKLTSPPEGKIYDGTPTFTAAQLGIGNIVSGDTVKLSGSADAADKNIGSDKPFVSFTGLSLTGASAGNYTVKGATGSGTITVRPLSTWSGKGTDSLWSNSANWDALPDGGNVLAVAIPSGSNVTFNGLVGNTLLKTLGNAGNLLLGGNDLNVGSYTQSGGSLTGSGNFNVTDSFSQTGGTINLSGSSTVKITQASGNLNLANVSAPTINLTASNGAITQTGAIVTATLATTSATGTLLNHTGNRIGSFSANNSGSGNIELTNTASPLLITGMVNAGGDILVDNTGATATDSKKVKASGVVSIKVHSPLSIGSGGVSAGGNIELTAGATAGAGDNLTISGAINSSGSGASVSLFAGDNLTQNANVSSNGGAISATALTGGISMALGTTTSGGNIGYSAPAGDIILASLNAGNGAITLGAGGNVSPVPGSTGANLIGASATLNIGGKASLNTQVKDMDATAKGGYTLTDSTTGATSSDTPTGTAEEVQQLANTLIPEVQKNPSDNNPSDELSKKPLISPAPQSSDDTRGGAGTPTFGSGSETIGGTEGTFGDTEKLLKRGELLNGEITDNTSSGKSSSDKDEKKEDRNSSSKNNEKDNNQESKPHAKPEKC